MLPSYLARHLRVVLALGAPVGPEGAWLQFDPLHYLIVPFIWIIIFTLMSVYDSRRTLRVVDDLQTVALAVMLAPRAAPCPHRRRAE